MRTIIVAFQVPDFIAKNIEQGDYHPIRVDTDSAELMLRKAIAESDRQTAKDVSTALSLFNNETPTT